MRRAALEERRRSAFDARPRVFVAFERVSGRDDQVARDRVDLTVASAGPPPLLFSQNHMADRRVTTTTPPVNDFFFYLAYSTG